MEHVEALSEGEWSSFSGMFSTEEADFMAQLLGNFPFPNEQDVGMSLEAPPTFWPGHEASTNMAAGDESLYYCSETVKSNSYYFPQQNNYSSGNGNLFVPTSGHENYLGDSNQVLLTINNSMPMDFDMVGQKNASLADHVLPDNLMEEAVCLKEETSTVKLGEPGVIKPEAVVLPNKASQPKRKSRMPELATAAEDKNDINPHENPSKKSRVSGDVQRNRKNVQTKKNQKLVPTDNNEEESNGGLNGQSSSSYCSEDDSNASQELNGGATSSSKGSAALNSNGKTRANRGSATDPQSLYARKRRERINERLRILQTLVPNGTKVDISTMLEEAVEYVKFLQLQIKLLSSDDLWMYAPIAYNGMNIGLDLKISPPL